MSYSTTTTGVAGIEQVVTWEQKRAPKTIPPGILRFFPRNSPIRIGYLRREDVMGDVFGARNCKM